MLYTSPPDYLPGVPFWARALLADSVQLAVGAQYVRQSGHNRARIRTPDGPQWLTIPVRRGQLGSSIAATRISPEGAWWRHHARALRYNYGSSPFFQHLMPEIEPLLSPDHQRLDEVTVPLIRILATWLGCRAPITVRREPVGPFGLFSEGSDVPVTVRPFAYRQTFDGFIPDLSAIDLIFNHGPGARDLILDHTSHVQS